MEPQTPAEGVLLRKNYGNAKVYNVTCECCGSNCEHNVCVEADDHNVTVTTYTQQKTKWWELNRWQVIWRLLTKGYVEYEASIIMSRQQALNYAKVLESATHDVAVFQKEQLEKNK